MLINRRALCSQWTKTLALGLLATVTLVAAGHCQTAWAQGPPYTWDKVDQVYLVSQTAGRQKAIKLQVIGGQQGLEANRTTIDNWYRKNIFAGMSSQEQMGRIPELRNELLKDLKHPGVNPTLHQFLVDVAYDEAMKRLRGNYHPAVRFNALLIIGDLNQVESKLASRTPAIRLPKALDILIEELKKPDQLDSLRLAALIGIQRHLFLFRQRPQDAPIPDAQKADISSVVQAMLEEKTPPAGRTPEGHTWMRRRAADVLATMGSVGDNDSVFNNLVAIVDDQDTPLSLRCTAARALERLDYAGGINVDPVAVSQQLGALAAFACRAEDERVKEEQKEEANTGSMPDSGYPGAGFGSYPGSGFGGGEGDGDEENYGDSEDGYYGSDFGSGSEAPKPKVEEEIDERIQRVRRRLKLPLHCVQLALKGKPKRAAPGSTDPLPLGGVGGLAKDEQVDQVTKIIDAVNNLIVASDTFENGLDEMMKEVRNKTRELEDLLPKAEEPVEEPAGNDALPGGGGSLPGGAKAAATGEKGKKK